MDRLEGRNPVLECLLRGKRQVHRLWLDRGARPDRRIQRILELAERRGVPVDRTDRRQLDKLSDGRVHNGVVADVDPLQLWSAQSLVDHVLEVAPDPFLVLADGLAYEHNLGAVLRSSLGFGVSGVILPTRKGASLSPVVQRVAMGAVEELPIAREGLYSAMKVLKRAGVRTIGADMGGTPATELDLRGPVALVMGAEGRGLSSKLRQRCDQVVSIPLRGNLESLNVSVAAAVIMYEKRRQDGWFTSEH